MQKSANFEIKKGNDDVQFSSSAIAEYNTFQLDAETKLQHHTRNEKNLDRIISGDTASPFSSMTYVFQIVSCAHRSLVSCIFRLRVYTICEVGLLAPCTLLCLAHRGLPRSIISV